MIYLDNQYKYIPSKDEVDEFEDYSFYVCEYKKSNFRYLISKYEFTNNYCLELTYSIGNYKAAEKKIFENYTFLNEAVDSEILGIMPTYEMKTDYYIVKIIDHKSYKYSYKYGYYFVAYNGINKIRYGYQDLQSKGVKDRFLLELYFFKGFRIDW